MKDNVWEKLGKMNRINMYQTRLAKYDSLELMLLSKAIVNVLKERGKI